MLSSGRRWTATCARGMADMRRSGGWWLQLTLSRAKEFVDAPGGGREAAFPLEWLGPLLAPRQYGQLRPRPQAEAPREHAMNVPLDSVCEYLRQWGDLSLTELRRRTAEQM